MGTLDKAIAIATRAHFGQRDKAGAPYVLHPLRVMLSLSTPEERIVGVLHDVVEDTSVTVADLRAEGFSDDVLTALDSVTKREGEDYMDFVARAAANPLGKNVKLADLKDNCNLSRIADPTDKDIARIEKYRLAIRVIEAMPTTTPLAEKPDPQQQPDMLAMVLRAASFAADKHRTQRRKDVEASPYINHPLALADVLAREGGVMDHVTLCAALLHDTIEDTKTTAYELAGLFGADIAAVVAEVTDDKTLHKDERKRLQVEHAGMLSDRAKLVKLSDKTANLRDLVRNPPADWSLERKREYFDWAKTVIDRLRGVHPRLEAVFDEALSKRP